MIYDFFLEFINLVTGSSHTYNVDIAYVFSTLFPICIVFALLCPVFGKVSARFIVYVILIFICLLILSEHGGALSGL